MAQPAVTPLEARQRVLHGTQGGPLLLQQLLPRVGQQAGVQGGITQVGTYLRGSRSS